jgi:hypothetical protein
VSVWLRPSALLVKDSGCPRAQRSNVTSGVHDRSVGTYDRGRGAPPPQPRGEFAARFGEQHDDSAPAQRCFGLSAQGIGRDHREAVAKYVVEPMTIGQKRIRA